MTASRQTKPRLSLVHPVPDDPGPIPADLADLYRQYSTYVAYIAHRLIGNPSEVDDVVQDVFMDAGRGLGKIREVKAIKGWLATITVRRAKRHLKKRRFKQFVGLDAVPEYSLIADRTVSAEQRALISSIYRILEDFSVNDRVAWTLKYIQGEKVNEVARLCGCSRATAHRRIAAVQAVINEVIHDGR